MISTNKIQNYFKAFDIPRWTFFGCLFLFTLGFGLIINDFVVALMKNDYNDNAWTAIDKFTTQSNMLLFFFTVIYVFFPNHQLLRKNKFLICTMAYIFFTFFGYNFILTFTEGKFLDDGTFVSGTYNGSSLAIFSSSITHALSPIAFIAAGFTKMYFDKNLQLDKFVKTVLPGMIYPTLYATYTASIPFVFNTHNPEKTYSIYGIATDTLNNPTIAWPIIVVMILVFFPGSIAMFYFSYKAIYKKMSKKRHTY